MKPSAFVSLLLATSAALTAAESAPVTWATATEILARIKAPTFPAHDFSIADYGAKPGGTIDNTAALRQAIAACSAAGGGRVVVPAGVFLTGAIHLKSNVNLHLLAGSTLLFSSDPAATCPSSARAGKAPSA